MAITTISALNTAQNNAKVISLSKQKQLSVAGHYSSTWVVAGYPDPGTPPGTLDGFIPTNSTPGAIPFVNSGTNNYILGLNGYYPAGENGGGLCAVLYDRLWHNSGMSGTVTTTTTLGSVPALTRPDANGGLDDNGNPTCLLLEFYTNIGTTAATLTVTYTNQSGTTGQVATYVRATNSTQTYQIIEIPLAVGDTGIRSVQSYSWSTSSGTAGNFGLTIARKLIHFPVLSPAGYVYTDWSTIGMPKFYDDACLNFMFWQGQGTSNFTFYLDLIIGNG